MNTYRLSEICEINPKKEIPLDGDSLVSFLPMEAVSTDGKIDTSKTVSVSQVKNYSVFKNNDIIFAKITPCMENGKGAIVSNLINGYGAGSTEFIVLRPNEMVLSKWIYYFLSQKSFRLYCQQNMTGSAGQKRVPAKFLANCEMRVPNIEEQKHLISKIEELFSELDNGVETLKKTKQQLAVYRQAVFNSVIDSYPGEKFVLSEIAKTIDGDRGKNYPKREEFSNEGFCLFLTAQNVRPYGWRFDNNSFITKGKDEILNNGKLQLNDIVLTTRGTLGNVAVYDATVPYENVRINSCMLIIRANTEKVSPYYLASFLMSPLFKFQVEKLKSGTAQPQIPANILKNTVISVPTLEEQKQIVSELNSRFSVCDSIEQTVDAALQQAEAMRQSILKKAFEGGL